MALIHWSLIVIPVMLHLTDLDVHAFSVTKVVLEILPLKSSTVRVVVSELND
jgi:hypothetical protein